MAIVFCAKMSQAFLAKMLAVIMLCDIEHEFVEVPDECVVTIPIEEVDFVIELRLAQVHRVPSTTHVIVETVDVDRDFNLLFDFWNICN